MIVEHAFDYTIVRSQCHNPDLYRNEDLTKAVDRVLHLPIFKNKVKGLKQNSQLGSGLTSVGHEYLAVAHLPGASGLTKWIEQQMVLAKPLLGIDKPGTSVKYKRSWANRLMRGSQGKCHRHVKVDEWIAELTDYSYVNFCPDIVGIFYVDLPPGSSKLALINNGEEYTELALYPEEDRHYVIPVEGELVLHRPEVWHAVTMHESDLPRNCFVFDADFV
jgi:hypothetical protein